ncbi:MAG: hypothetical protein H6729_07780 [Deltaproteobacteria bacterium]|nr:hypothetical protein [Deltaproteobacteria bacterium]
MKTAVLEPHRHTIQTWVVRFSVLLSLGASACATAKAPQEPPAQTAARDVPAPPPSGPTQTDFKIISKRLVKRCIAGGWINRWRANNSDVNAAKPKIFLAPFDDATGLNLDPEYLRTTLERRMRRTQAFEMVADRSGCDFIGQGKLHRLAERGPKGERFSVYTATLALLDPTTEKVAYSCEATVRGEM